MPSGSQLTIRLDTASAAMGNFPPIPVIRACSSAQVFHQELELNPGNSIDIPAVVGAVQLVFAVVPGQVHVEIDGGDPLTTDGFAWSGDSAAVPIRVTNDVGPSTELRAVTITVVAVKGKPTP